MPPHSRNEKVKPVLHRVVTFDVQKDAADVAFVKDNRPSEFSSRRDYPMRSTTSTVASSSRTTSKSGTDRPCARRIVLGFAIERGSNKKIQFRHYIPLNCGLRFSLNARIPSAQSSVFMHVNSDSDSITMTSSNGSRPFNRNCRLAIATGP